MDWCQIIAGAQTITKTNDKRTLSQSSVKLKLKELFFFFNQNNTCQIFREEGKTYLCDGSKTVFIRSLY